MKINMYFIITFFTICAYSGPVQPAAGANKGITIALTPINVGQGFPEKQQGSFLYALRGYKGLPYFYFSLTDDHITSELQKINDRFGVDLSGDLTDQIEQTEKFDLTTFLILLNQKESKEAEFETDTSTFNDLIDKKGIIIMTKETQQQLSTTPKITTVTIRSLYVKS